MCLLPCLPVRLGKPSRRGRAGRDGAFPSSEVGLSTPERVLREALVPQEHTDPPSLLFWILQALTTDILGLSFPECARIRGEKKNKIKK